MMSCSGMLSSAFNSIQRHQNLSKYVYRIVKQTYISKGQRNPINKLWRRSRCQDDLSQLSHSRSLITLLHHHRPALHQHAEADDFHYISGPEVATSWWAIRDNSRISTECLRVLPEQTGKGKGRARPCGRPFPKALDTDNDCWDPWLYVENERLTHTEDLKEVKIGPLAHHVVNISTSLTEGEENKIVNQLVRNFDCSPMLPLTCQQQTLEWCASISPSTLL